MCFVLFFFGSLVPRELASRIIPYRRVLCVSLPLTIRGTISDADGAHSSSSSSPTTSTSTMTTCWGTATTNLYLNLAFPSKVAIHRRCQTTTTTTTKHQHHHHSRGPTTENPSVVARSDDDEVGTQSVATRGIADGAHRAREGAPVAALARIVGGVEALGGILIVASHEHDPQEAKTNAAALAASLSRRLISWRTVTGRKESDDVPTEDRVPIGFWIPPAAAMESVSVRHDVLPEHEMVEGHPEAAQHAARQLQAWLEESQGALNTFG